MPENRAAATERDEYSSAERTVRVKVGSKVILASFLKVEGRRTLVGEKTGKRGQIEKLVGG